MASRPAGARWSVSGSKASWSSVAGPGPQGSPTAPCGGGGGDRTVYLALVAQEGQVGYCLAAVGEHHRHVDRYPAGIVAGAARPQPVQRIGEGAGQPGTRSTPCGSALRWTSSLVCCRGQTQAKFRSRW